MHNHDRALGAQDVGGLVYATIQCPIFDPRPDIGNFSFKALKNQPNRERGEQGLNNKRIRETSKPLETFNPFATAGFVRVVNVLALPYYEISEHYQCTPEYFATENWLKLLDLGRVILTQEQSIGAFIDRVTVRVRLAAGAESGWEKDAKKHIMQVSSPAFGQIIQDESIGTPIHPPAHNANSKVALTKTFAEIDRKAKAWDERAAQTQRS